MIDPGAGCTVTFESPPTLMANRSSDVSSVIMTKQIKSYCSYYFYEMGGAFSNFGEWIQQLQSSCRISYCGMIWRLDYPLQTQSTHTHTHTYIYIYIYYIYHESGQGNRNQWSDLGEQFLLLTVTLDYIDFSLIEVTISIPNSNDGRKSSLIYGSMLYIIYKIKHKWN